MVFIAPLVIMHWSVFGIPKLTVDIDQELILKPFCIAQECQVQESENTISVSIKDAVLGFIFFNLLRVSLRAKKT